MRAAHRIGDFPIRHAGEKLHFHYSRRQLILAPQMSYQLIHQLDVAVAKDRPVAMLVKAYF
jgi:hypothetical protein